MIDYRIAIPSFGRPGGLAMKTLPMLMNGGVDLGRVTVFLAQRDPLVRNYADILGDMGGVDFKVLDVQGIRDKRRAMVEHYPAGTPLLQLDDDIHSVHQVRDGKLRPLTNVDALIQEGFQRTADAALYCWGISPVANAFYMDEGKWTDGLRFVAAAWMGQYTRPGHPVHMPRPALKEDYDICLRHYWYDGGLIRAAGVAMKVDYQTPGGVAAYRNSFTEQAACDQLICDWPGLVRMNTRRKTPEVLLTPRPRGQARSVTVPPPGLG